jgi:hypothetical protein
MVLRIQGRAKFNKKNVLLILRDEALNRQAHEQTSESLTRAARRIELLEN